MRIHLVITTINVPFLLEDYVRHALKLPAVDIQVTVAGDNKTPEAARVFCTDLQERFGIPITYQGVAEQTSFLKRWPLLDSFLPWNCIQRRNVAILEAYSKKADVVVTIDDDNFIATENYFEAYRNLGKNVDIPTIKTRNGWYNICETLEDRQDRKFFPRGYPLNQRGHVEELPEESRTNARVMINGGLWLGDPDIDAVTRLAAPIEVMRYSRSGNFVLDKGTWCPFNSQNTGIHRDCIPAYFLCPNVGRYDDIWASFIVLKIAEHLGDKVGFGEPLVKQTRNPHNLWKDFDDERMGLQLSDRLCVWLRETPLSGKTYKSSCMELIKALGEQIDHQRLELGINQVNFLENFIAGYKIWSDLDLWE